MARKGKLRLTEDGLLKGWQRAKPAKPKSVFSMAGSPRRFKDILDKYTPPQQPSKPTPGQDWTWIKGTPVLQEKRNGDFFIRPVISARGQTEPKTVQILDKCSRHIEKAKLRHGSRIPEWMMGFLRENNCLGYRRDYWD